MVSFFSGANFGRSSAGSWLSKWFAARHNPRAFTCGVRIVSGPVPGESTRWRYRASGADPLLTPAADGRVEVDLQHGTVRLRLLVDPAVPTPANSRRPFEIVFAADLAEPVATIEISVGAGHRSRFGLLE